MPTGRVTTVTDEVKKKFLEAIKRGNFREPSAAHAGVSYKAIQRYLKKNTPESKQFRHDLEDAESKTEMELFELQFEAARAGDTNTGRWLLIVKNPHRYGQQRIIMNEIKRLEKKLELEREILRGEILRTRRERAVRKKPSHAERN